MKRVVLTGGHGAGKSTLLLALDALGVTTVREAASDYQRLQRARGIAFPSDAPDFEAEVLRMHLQREARVREAGDLVVFDRGAPDHVVYADQFGWSLPDALRCEALALSYDLVLVVPPFGGEWGEHVGRADRRINEKLVPGLEAMYRELGIPVETVPPGPLDARVRFLRERLSVSGCYSGSTSAALGPLLSSRSESSKKKAT